MFNYASPCPNPLPDSQQLRLLDKLDVFAIRGHDKRGRRVLRVIGKLFPARLVSIEVLKTYLEEKIYPKLEDCPFVVVYLHAGVQRSNNCPRITALWWLYEAIPVGIKQNLEALYFVHPSLQSRLFLATFGRLIFTGGFYSKIKYIIRLEFLWEHLRRKEMGEIPEFVTEHDEELEEPRGAVMDYGLESDHPRIHRGLASMDAVVHSYSMRGIA